MQRRAFLKIAAWSGAAGSLTAPALAAAKAAAKVVDPARLDNFMGLSSFLLGIPLPGIKRLDPTLGALFLAQLDGYLANPTAFANYNQEKWGTAGFDIPAQPDWLCISPSTMNKLLTQWQAIKTAGGDIKIAVDSQIFGVVDLSTMAQKIIAIWYTGLINNIPGPAIAYSKPWVWEVSHAHPEAVPRSFGYWQYDPTHEGTSGDLSDGDNSTSQGEKS